MPLNATVTMVDAVNGESVTVNLKLNDGTTDVIDQDFSVQYRSSHDGLQKDVQPELLNLMQAEIDRFKVGDSLKKDSEYTSMAANIQAGLVV